MFGSPQPASRRYPAAANRGGASSSPVARFPQSDVGGAVFARIFELDEAAANPVRPELGGRDLEVHVGLAARLRDLAPASADLVTRSGIDPVIRGVVGHLVDRGDGERRG